MNMRQYRSADLESSQKSIWYWSGQGDEDAKLGARPDYYSLSHTHMLIQDVSNAVLPVPGYTKAKYEIQLVPTDANLEELIVKALKDRGHRRSLTDAAYDFFQECASTMTAFGRADYEIVYLSNAEGKIVTFTLSRIQPLTLVSRRGRVWQYVPKRIAHERDLSSQYVELVPLDILSFRLPIHFQRKHRQMMESLAFMSINFLPDFTMSNLKGETRVPFDLGEFSRVQKIALARSTREIGWNGRQLFRERTLEYYFFYRHLVFERFKCEMRNSIVETLNLGIQRAGAKIGFEGSLNIVGLATLADIEHALSRLEDGGGDSFDEVMKPFIY